MTRLDLSAAAILVCAAAAPAAAQTLPARIDAAPSGLVQFSFPARQGVCGDGSTYIRTGPNSFSGTFTGSVAETLNSRPCEPGPVRVLLDRAEREIIEVRTYVGPGDALPPNTDLGAVPAQEAVTYLFGLAARGAGRVGRDALFPAALAAGVELTDGLITISRNQALARETRSAALGHLGRARNDAAEVPPRTTRALVDIARDVSDNLAVREQALVVLGRLDHGAGIPSLTELAREPDGGFLAREATGVLASSGDPRARAFLRAAVQDADLEDEALTLAIRGLGERYATREDAELLRTLYVRLTSERTRDAALTAIASVGGGENVRWLLDRARDPGAQAGRRRKALEQAVRAGAPLAELIRTYDSAAGDHQLKAALVAIYARSAEGAALDRLIWIAQNETDVNVRRRAVAALSRSEDPRAREALRAIVTRQ